MNNMKFRRLFALMLVLVFAVSMLTGCSSSKDEADSKDAASGEKDYSIEITDDIQAIIDRGQLIVGVKTDVPGFGYYDKETKEYSGKEIDLSYQIAAKIFDTTVDEAKSQNLVEFVQATVENRSTLLVEDTVDLVIATFTITDERKEMFAFSDSYYSDYIGIMVKKSKADTESLGSDAITSITNLDGKNVGVAQSADTRTHMLAYIDQNDYEISPRFMNFATYPELYKALKKGEIDAFAVDTSILNGYLDDSLTILPDRFSEQKYGAAANKSDEGLVKAVNVVIEENNY
ncbi:MAG: transporter substrate-binding domain-containing protein [Lachnospiraceae bacterium]|nr:transporter substrate-binding domain-containing protein [Lachnospiraceae bacterium]